MVEFRSQVIKYCHFGLVLNQIHRPKALVFDLMRLSNHLSFSKKLHSVALSHLHPLYLVSLSLYCRQRSALLP